MLIDPSYDQVCHDRCYISFLLDRLCQRQVVKWSHNADIRPKTFEALQGHNLFDIIFLTGLNFIFLRFLLFLFPFLFNIIIILCWEIDNCIKRQKIIFIRFFLQAEISEILLSILTRIFLIEKRCFLRRWALKIIIIQLFLFLQTLHSHTPEYCRWVKCRRSRNQSWRRRGWWNDRCKSRSRLGVRCKPKSRGWWWRWSKRRWTTSKWELL